MWDPHVSSLFFLLSFLLSYCPFLLCLLLLTKARALAPPPPTNGHLHPSPCAKPGPLEGRNAARRSNSRPGARVAASRVSWPGARATTPKGTASRAREQGPLPAACHGHEQQQRPIRSSTWTQPVARLRSPAFAPRNMAAEPPSYAWLVTWPPASRRHRSSGRAQLLLRNLISFS